MAGRYGAPECRMDCAATDRSLRLGMDTKLHHPRSRPGLWRDFHPALRAMGIRDQPIAPRSSWQNQMQVFLWTLEQRLADASTQRLANLANASLCISLSQGFEPDDDDLRVAELVAYALVQRREAPSAKLLGRLGMYSINPLLGLLGAHLMLHDQKEPSRDVFLGYCSSSRATAVSLKNFLQSTGAAVLDWQTDFIAGRSILAQIEEAASRCNAGIFTKDDDHPDHPLTQRCRMRGRAAIPEGHRHWRKGARPRPSAHPALQESLRAAVARHRAPSRSPDPRRRRARRAFCIERPKPSLDQELRYRHCRCARRPRPHRRSYGALRRRYGLDREPERTSAMTTIRTQRVSVVLNTQGQADLTGSH
jgi:Predicted nucleotide-binding protein containing TIR-like domain